MNVLEFEVKNQVLKRIDSQDVLTDTKNDYKCYFNFEEDSEWVDVNKFVIFKDGWGNSSTVHLGNNEEVLSCIVPNKVLRGSYFKISVYGGDLLTTNNVVIVLLHSGYKRKESNPCPSNPNVFPIDFGFEKKEKDVFVDIFERLDNVVDSIVYENNSLVLFCKENILETVYLPFLKEEDINFIVEMVVAEYINNSSIVTENNNGFMSYQDKIKLDGIEDGATRNIVDMELDIGSSNPISNNAVTDALNGKEDSYNLVERLDNLIIDLINKGD